MLSLPSPFLPLLPSPCPVHILLIWTVREKKREACSHTTCTWLSDRVLKCACLCVLCRRLSSLCSIWPSDWRNWPTWRRTCPSMSRPVTRLCWRSSWSNSTVSGKSCVWRWELTEKFICKQRAGGLCVLGTADETGKREKERLGREGGKSCYQLCFGGDQQHKALHHTQRHAHKHTQTLTLICVRKEPACAGSWRENCICLLFSNLPPCKPNDLFVNISSAVWWISQVVFRLYPAELVLLVSAK